MCGILGYIGNRNIDVKSATDIISHRGPDAEGFLRWDEKNQVLMGLNALEMSNQEFHINFGFRRLAIIDLTKEANQPMYLPIENVAIVFNGEIYNYRELRNDLIEKGRKFHTQSDTEVLLQAYLEWGDKCVEFFNGMWAFAILDLKAKKLFCSRDRFGIKPFFYHHDKKNKSFIFSSEIKQLFKVGVEKKINENVIKDFLTKTINDHTDETFFEGIFHLQQGHNMIIDLEKAKNGKIELEIKRYWKLQPQDEYQKISFSDASIQFKELFESSIDLRFRSDVPVGSCLSGGLDSSAIVCTAANRFNFDIHAFTSTFQNPLFDESDYVRKISKKYQHVKNYYCSLTEDLFVDEVDKVIWHQDEPFGTFGILAQWEVMKLAKKNNVTVLLDGQGGDETMGGYRKFYVFFLKELFHKLKLLSALMETFYLLSNKEFNFFHREGFKRYLGQTKNVPFLSEQGKRLTSLANIGWGSVKTMREKSLEDIEKYSFPPLLRYEDRNSMAHSIETRVPFMDYRLVQFLHSLPSSFLIKDGYTKAILRNSLKGILPDETRLRKSKLGFATPQSVWMEKNLNKYFSDYFHKMDNPYLNSPVVYKEFLKYPKSSLHAWDFSRFFLFDKWYQSNFN